MFRNGKAEIVHRYGEEEGIRDTSGFLLFFPTVTHFTDQEARYRIELEEKTQLAERLLDAINGVR